MLTMDGTATLVIWRPQESQFNNVAGLLEGFALNKLYVAKGYKPSRYHRQPLRPKGRRLASKLRRSSAYLERRAALASSPDASGAVDNRLALAQSCAGQGEYGCNAHTRTASLYWVDSPVRRAQKLDTPGWCNPRPSRSAHHLPAGFCMLFWSEYPRNANC